MISAHRGPDSWTENPTDEDLGFKTIFAEYENFLDSNFMILILGYLHEGRVF